MKIDRIHWLFFYNDHETMLMLLNQFYYSNCETIEHDANIVEHITVLLMLAVIFK